MKAQYEVLIEERLDIERWADWFEGMVLTPRCDGTTLLRGEVCDQAALHGILGRVRDLGLTLVGVQRIEMER